MQPSHHCDHCLRLGNLRSPNGIVQSARFCFVEARGRLPHFGKRLLILGIGGIRVLFAQIDLNFIRLCVFQGRLRLVDPRLLSAQIGVQFNF